MRSEKEKTYVIYWLGSEDNYVINMYEYYLNNKYFIYEKLELLDYDNLICRIMEIKLSGKKIALSLPIQNDYALGRYDVGNFLSCCKK